MNRHTGMFGGVSAGDDLAGRLRLARRCASC